VTTKERRVVLAFLADGLTHREIDLILGRNPATTKGWHSFGILTKQFSLVGSDRGSLFLAGRKDASRICGEVVLTRKRAPLDLQLPKLRPPRVLEPYRDTLVLARNAKAVQAMLAGEARNLIQSFFSGRKAAAGTCQMHGCRESNHLDSVHMSRTRPQLFIEAAKRHSVSIGARWQFDVYSTMRAFLLSHMGLQQIAFLCKPHHRLLDKLRESDPAAYRGLVRTLAKGFHAGAAI
jgi:hypothetical protein